MRHCDQETWVLALLAVCVSIAAFLFYFDHRCILLYGDAVAHINIARRVFDSCTPGLLQLGTAWLPLPHLLLIRFLPFVSLWRSGVGGSVAAVAANGVGAVGTFRLLRGAVGLQAGPSDGGRVAAWLGA